MEVHHHPNVEKKNFKEYFLEFLMIFLAVTLGFFAESLREHITENEKAAVFAQSLYADFKTDTASLHQLIEFTELKIKSVDSLEYFTNLPRRRDNDSALYRCVVNVISTFQFDNINGTYEQIKNSGSLRFFDQLLVNNMNSYDATSLKLKLMEDWENKVLFEQVLPQADRMFNFKVFNDLRNRNLITHEMYLKKMDKESVDILINQADMLKRLRERQLNQHKLLLQKATEILTDLKKEFHLEKE